MVSSLVNEEIVFCLCNLSHCIFREVQEEEQEAFFNMPEGFQSGSRGEKMQIAIDKMEGFVSQIESVQSDIEDFAKG